MEAVHLARTLFGPYTAAPRQNCWHRGARVDAWLSCAGSGELAPEVGIFNHNCFGPWLVSPTRSMTRVRCNIPGRGFVARTGTEIPEQLLSLPMWLLRR